MRRLQKRGTVSDEFLHIIGLVIIPTALFILMMAVIVREGADTKYFVLFEARDLANAADTVMSTTGTVFLQYTSLGTTIREKKGFVHAVNGSGITVISSNTKLYFPLLVPTSKTVTSTFSDKPSSVVTLVSDSNSLSFIGTNSATIAARPVSLYQQDCAQVKGVTILPKGTGQVATFAKQQLGTAGKTPIQIIETPDTVRTVMIVYKDSSADVACVLNNALAKRLNKFGGSLTPISLLSVQNYPSVAKETLSDSSVALILSGSFVSEYASIVQAMQEVANG
ncbi:MAG TPA: hypothetical protein VK158_01895 [Acidobacteriota bacterium]|nr:hypothetical protein [Acidobacteriota bacterium]